MRFRAARACVAATVVAGVATACTGSAVGGIPSVNRTHTAKLACELITPDVLKAARFTYRVLRRTTSNGAGKNGASAWTYGDDPNPADLSSNFLALLVMTPASLAAQHTTARKEAVAIASPCPANAVRQLGPSGGVGSYAYFCVKQSHAPAGGWLQGGDVYLLEVGSPDVDYGTTAQRVSEFESVARAISANAA